MLCKFFSNVLWFMICLVWVVNFYNNLKLVVESEILVLVRVIMWLMGLMVNVLKCRVL